MRHAQRRHRPFGSGRYFWVQMEHGARGGWYYETREGAHGPFPSRASAEANFLRHAEQRASAG